MRKALIHIRGNLGDMICFAGIASVLKEQGDELYVFTRNDTKAITVLNHFDCFREVFVFEYLPININDYRQCAFEPNLIDAPWIYPITLLKVPYVVNLSTVPGFEGTLSKDVTESIHERYASVLGIPYQSIRPGKWVVTPEENLMAKTWIENNAGKGSGPLIFYQFHAASKERRLPPKTAYDVYEGLVQRDYRVVVAYLDKGSMDYIDFAAKRVSSCSSLPLTLSCAIASRCDLILSTDTGFFHLSAGLGIPAIGIFGPTKFDVTSRYYPLAMKVSPGKVLPCANCYYRCSKGWSVGCRQNGCKQMEEYSAEDLLNAVDGYFGKGTILQSCCDRAVIRNV